ncbi:MAG TPA: hypothetical protein VK116_09940, partial [Planctomycetota bacterium]|nr:hypothetical protein [Planctomycetota bacterium]
MRIVLDPDGVAIQSLELFELRQGAGGKRSGAARSRHFRGHFGSEQRDREEKRRAQRHAHPANEAA